MTFGPYIGGLRAALCLLTRIPVGPADFRDVHWQWAPGFFPVVGLMVGALAAIVWQLSASAGALVAATLAVAATMLVTGALHEDGLADTADALGGATDRQGIFAILKDSRVGSYGAAALIVSIVLRVALVARVGAAGPGVLILCHCAARMPLVWLMTSLPYVTPAEVARSPVSGASRPQLALASAWLALTGLWFVMSGRIGGAEVVGLAFAAVAVSLAARRWFDVRAGGLTGDFLGATEQTLEAAFLLVLAL
jgi:adenosylcobinamide-GDP ribazoletransferase